MAIAILAVVFVALYMNSNALYRQCNGNIYAPKKKETLQDSTPPLKEVISSDKATSDNKISLNNPRKQGNGVSSKTSSLSISSNQTASTKSEESSSDTLIISKDNSFNTTTSREENLPVPTQSSSEISSMPSSSSTPSSTPSSSSSTPSSSTSSEIVDDPVAKENTEKVALISDTYGVSLTIPLSQSDFHCEYILSYSKNSEEIKYGLIEIQSCLKSFPIGFFSKTSNDINVILVSKTTTDNIITIDSTMIVPCFKTVSSSEINPFLLSISAQNLSEQVTPNYDSYNPIGFVYGCVKTRYNYTASQSVIGYFISSKAQASSSDDLYETFMAIFKKASTLQRVPPSSPYYNKLSYTCKLLVEWSDCFSDIPVVKKFL